MAVTWSTSNKHASVTLSNGDLTATSSGGFSGESGRCDTAITALQKVYFELVCNVTFANCTGLGFCDSTETFAANFFISTDVKSLGCYADPACKWNNASQFTMPAFGNGDVIGFVIDGPNGTYYIRVNGGIWNNNGSADPDTNTGGLTNPMAGDIFAAYAGGGSGQITLNAMASSFAFTKPSTATALDPGEGHTLDAASGSLTVTGTDATFSRGYLIGADTGALAVLGTAASFLRGLRLDAAAGTVAITGSDAALVAANENAVTPPGRTVWVQSESRRAAVGAQVRSVTVSANRAA